MHHHLSPILPKYNILSQLAVITHHLTSSLKLFVVFYHQPACTVPGQKKCSYRHQCNCTQSTYVVARNQLAHNCAQYVLLVLAVLLKRLILVISSSNRRQEAQLSLFVSAQLTNVTDAQTAGQTPGDSTYRAYAYASRGKNE